MKKDEKAEIFYNIRYGFEYWDLREYSKRDMIEFAEAYANSLNCKKYFLKYNKNKTK